MPGPGRAPRPAAPTKTAHGGRRWGGRAPPGRPAIALPHGVANLDVCDRLLVLVPGGKVAYFGPPADGLAHFGQPGWAQVFRAFEAEPDRDWAGEYRRSAYCAQYGTAAMQGHRPDAA